MTSSNHYTKDADKLEHAQLGVTATRHGSNTTEGSGHETDGVPARFGVTATRHGSNTTEGSGHETDGTPRRSRPSLERVYYCYVLRTC